MKIFVYKTLFIAIIFFIIFHLTFGYLLKSYEKKFYNNFSSEKINSLKEKVREELTNALEKDIGKNKPIILVDVLTAAKKAKIIRKLKLLFLQ